MIALHSHNCMEKMIIHTLKDPSIYIGSAGASLAFIGQWVAEHINPLIGSAAGMLGLIILVLTIIEKSISIRKQLRNKNTQPK